MSGDSPNVHRTNDVFELKDTSGRTSPAPTTSKDVAVQSSSGGISDIGGGTKVVEASILVEPNKDDERNELSSPTLNNSADDHKDHDPEKTLALEDVSYSGKDRDRDDKRRDKKKLNGDIDRLDGVWLPKEQRRKQFEQEEERDGCVVKCLYVTMQCCECNIM